MSYTLSHPDGSAEIEVEAEQVPLFQAQGWQTKPGATPVEQPDQGPVVTDLTATEPPKKKS